MRLSLFLALSCLAFVAQSPVLLASDESPLKLVAKISLGSVSGRIDHMAIDHARHRLFIAELGNDSVGVVDLEQRTVLKRITGLAEPQGVAYSQNADILLIANGDDGSIRAFRGADFSPVGRLDLKRDADNMRTDPTNNRVWVGFGSGALADIDPATLQKVGEVALKDHPEGFQLDPSGKRIFVNVPDAHEVAVLDRTSGAQVATWKMAKAAGNFPIALMGDGERVAVVYRYPSRLMIFDAGSGSVVTDMPTCGDADDVFSDEQRHRLYISCGSGAIDVFDTRGSTVAPVGHIPTVAGARTSLFDPETDRLYLAVRARIGSQAEIWEFQPN